MKVRGVQQKIAILISTFALIAFVADMIICLTLRNLSALEALQTAPVLATGLSALFFFFTRNIDHVAIRIMHLVAITLVAVFAILDTYDSFYGLGFIILIVLIAYRYGFLDTGLMWKAAIILIFFLALIEFSARSGEPEDQGTGIMVIAYLVFFAMSIYLVYTDEIKKLSSTNKSLGDTLTSLRREHGELEKRLVANTEEISRLLVQAEEENVSDEELQKSLKSEFAITNKEFEILMYFNEHGGTTRNISEVFGIKESTVKQHIHQVLQKLDARNRSDAIIILREYLKR